MQRILRIKATRATVLGIAVVLAAAGKATDQQFVVAVM